MRGHRILRIDLEALMEFFQEREGRARSYTIGNPLPDDVKVERVLLDDYRQWLTRVVLSSETWPPDDVTELPDPCITVHYEPAQ